MYVMMPCQVAELRVTALALTDATALVFNCQMGRGRTTTGMVCGSILLLAVRGWKPNSIPNPLALALTPHANLNPWPQPSSGARLEASGRGAEGASRCDERGPTVLRRHLPYLATHPRTLTSPHTLTLLHPSYQGRNLPRGEFKGVLQLLALMDEELNPAAAAGGEPGASKPARRGSSTVMPAGIGLQAKLLADESASYLLLTHVQLLYYSRALTHSPTHEHTYQLTNLQAKLLADECIDACAHAQNMVEAIVECQQSAGKAEIGAARSPEFWLRRGRNYMER
jgi:hypothetical protein